MILSKVKYFSLIIGFFGLLALPVQAQTPQLGITVTGYGQFTPPRDGAPGLFSAGGPQLGFTWQDRSLNSHEIKVGGLAFGAGGTPVSTIFQLGASYQYRQFLFRQKEWKVQPFLVVSGGVGFGLGNTASGTVSSQFGSTTTAFSVSGAVGPGLRWGLSDRMYLDVALPVTLGRGSYQSYKTQDPSVIDQSSFDFRQGLLDMRAEVGLGIYLGNRKAK